MKSSTLNIVLKAGDAAGATASFKTLSDAMTEVGFVKHTTAGQIDLTVNITYPGSFSGTTHYPIGFEIRKLVAAGKPTMYCKVWYGLYSQNTAAGGVHSTFRFQFGTSVDASGNIGGARTGYDGATIATNQGTFPTNAFSMWVASDGQTIERTRDQITGVYDAQGMIYNWLGGIVTSSSGNMSTLTTSSRYGICDFNSSYERSIGFPSYAVPANLHNNSTGVAGASALFPLLVSMPAIKANATMCIGYYDTEVAVGTEFDVSMYGSTLSFVACGSGYPSYDGGAGSTYVRAGLRIN